MGKVIYYDILKDRDNWLKGLIAEMVFERVSDHLLNGSLQCCPTLDPAHFLSLTRDASKFHSNRVYIELDLETLLWL